MLASGLSGIDTTLALSSNNLFKFLSSVIVIRVFVCTGKLHSPRSQRSPNGILIHFFYLYELQVVQF